MTRITGAGNWRYHFPRHLRGQPMNDHKCDVCGKQLSECADNDNDHLCDTCGKKLTEHTGGTATCTAKAVCTVCGKEYGEMAPHDFTAENTDAKYLVTAASCTAKAVYHKSCTVCGAGRN